MENKILASSGLEAAWSKLTGTPQPAIRHRIRSMRVCGLMPNNRVHRNPLKDGHIACFIVAMLGSDRHDLIEDRVHAYRRLKPCVLAGDTNLRDHDIVLALAQLLRMIREGRDVRLRTLIMSPDRLYAALHLENEAGDVAIVQYGEPADLDDEQAGCWPIENTHTLSGQVIHALAEAIEPDPETKI
jgi:hypothetical protein